MQGNDLDTPKMPLAFILLSSVTNSSNIFKVGLVGG